MNNEHNVAIDTVINLITEKMKKKLCVEIDHYNSVRDFSESALVDLKFNINLIVEKAHNTLELLGEVIE